jgi:nitronate monooxygenase
MIRTPLTELFALRHPIVLGAMGSVSGGALAAAVSNAGGLGLIGGGYGDKSRLRVEMGQVRRETTRPWGIGLITWSIGREVLELALDHRPDAFLLSFGDPRPHAPKIKAAGCKLICQVQDLAQARLARDAGADVIVAEGKEAGGHSGLRGTLSLVPAVVDAVSPVPVVAAGGIADGRGVAAALMLGAAGVLMGTRFYASTEAHGDSEAKRRIVAGSGDDTTRTRVFDIVRNYSWPDENPGRALRNRFLERWHGHENELARNVEREMAAYQAAAQAGDFDTAVVWASEAIDLIHGIKSAAAIIERISAEAESLLRAGPDRLSA